MQQQGAANDEREIGGKLAVRKADNVAVCTNLKNE